MALDVSDYLPRLTEARYGVDGIEVSPRVMVVDGPRPLRAALAGALEAAGYSVECAGTERQVFDLLTWWSPDVMLVDLSCDFGLGASFFRQIQGGHRLPVIVVAASGEEAKVLAALEAGARDFVIRPMNLDEVSLRISAILQRWTDKEPGNRIPGRILDTIRAGPVVVYPARRAVVVRGNEVHFPAREYDLLLRFVRHAGEVQTKQALLNQFWGDSSSGAQTLNTHMRRLRAKVEIDPKNPRHFITIRNVGFRFDVGESTD